VVTRIFLRAGTAVATLLLVTAAVFALVHLAAGDVLDTGAGEGARLNPEMRQAFREVYRLDEPPVKRYALWLAGLARGDLGLSLVDRRPVAQKIEERIGLSLTLNAAAIAVMALLSIPLGLASAWRPGSRTDRVVAGLTFLLYAVPAFWAALMLQWVFAVGLGWFPLFGPGGGDGVQGWARVGDRAAHLVLPVVCLSYGGLAYLVRFVRGGLLETGSAEVVRAARARGVPEFRAFARHGLRQAAVPMLTLAGFLLPRLLGGSVIIETVFALPGLGRLLVEAAFGRDLPTLLGLTVLSGAATLAGIVLADVSHALVDPRTRREA
jgi:peptide/nickel transport system permease protein